LSEDGEDGFDGGLVVHVFFLGGAVAMYSMMVRGA